MTRALRVVEGTPETHSNELEPLQAWFAAPQEDDDGLLAVIAATGPIALHPYDEDTFAAMVTQVEAAPAEAELDAAWLALTLWCASVLDRYKHSYPTDLGSAVRRVRRDLPVARGPRVVAANGAFRRGDLVCRPVGKGGELVAVHDAVYLDAEPPNKHAQTYGRMAAVHMLTPVVRIDRWYLDQIYLGLDFGRPF